MRFRKTTIIPVLVFLVSCIGLIVAIGDTTMSQVPLRLTIEKSVEMAIAHNEQILIANEAIEEAEGVYTEYAADAFPQLSGSIAYTRHLERMYTEVDMTMLNPILAQAGAPPLEVEKSYFNNKHEWDFRLSLSQNIFTFGKVSNALALGDISRRLARQAKKITIHDVKLQTKKSFFNVLYAKEVLHVMQANLERSQETRDIVKAKTDQGVMSRFDLLVMEAEVAAAKPPVLQAENSVLLTTQALLNIIGEPLDRPVQLESGLLFASLQEDTPDLISTGLRNRPELSMLHMQQDLYDTSYRLFRATYFPTLAASGSYAHTGGTDAHIWPDDPGEELQPSLSFGIQLYVPLFDGLRSYGQMRQMQAKKRSAQLQERMLVRGIRMEITALVSRIRLQEQVFKANQEAQRVVEEAYNLARLRFENGLGTRLEMTDAKTILRNAMLGVVTSLYNLNNARAELDRALGR